MTSIEYCERGQIHGRALELVRPANSVLDIGCGIRPQQFITPNFIICIEPYEEYIEVLKRNLKGTPAIIIAADALDALRAMPDKSIDTIFLLDVIEHMTREIGLSTIRECERVASQQIVVFTPLGFMPQEIHAGDSDTWNLGGGSFQQHKSGWKPEDFPGWTALVCRDHHDRDFKGQVINPPYGAFYAIKTFECSESTTRTPELPPTGFMIDLEDAFPAIFDGTLERQLQKIRLRTGLLACQRTTELLMAKDKKITIEDIHVAVETWRAEHHTAAVRNFYDEVKDFSHTFYALGTEDTLRVVKGNFWLQIAALQRAIQRRESSLAEKERLLASHVTNLAAWEKSLRQRSIESEKRRPAGRSTTFLRRMLRLFKP